jgi:hypothetical protein
MEGLAGSVNIIFESLRKKLNLRKFQPTPFVIKIANQWKVK